MKKTTITIVIPCFNEAKRLKAVFLRDLKSHRLQSPSPISIKEVIFVNDGSTDQTLRVLKSIRDEVSNYFKCKISILTYKVNKGKGYALCQGAQATKSDYVLYIDADLSISLSNIDQAVTFIQKGYDVIIGSKKMPGAVEVVKRSLLRRLLGKGYSSLTNFILGLNISDYSAGFKIFSKRAVDDLFSMTKVNRWSFDTEVIFYAQRYGYKIVEFPVVWSDVAGSTVNPIRDIIPTLIDTISIRKNWILKNY